MKNEDINPTNTPLQPLVKAFPLPGLDQPYQATYDLGAETYGKFFDHHPYACLSQAPAWPKVKRNWQGYFPGILNAEGTQILAASLVLIRSFPLGMRIMYVPGGPLLDFEDKESLTAFLTLLRKMAKKYRVMAVRLQPAWTKRTFPLKEAVRTEGFDPQALPSTPHTEQILQTFADQGFHPEPYSPKLSSTIQPRFQAILEAQGWTGKPKSKMKYQLKQCDRYGLYTQVGREDELDAFCECIASTEAEQNISLRSKEYFATILAVFPDSLLLTAYLEPRKSIPLIHRQLDTLQGNLQRLPASAPKKKEEIEGQINNVEATLAILEEVQKTLPDTCERTPVASALLVPTGQVVEMPYAGSKVALLKIPAVWQVFWEAQKLTFEKLKAKKLNLGGVDGSFADGLSIYKAHFDPIIYENLGEFTYIRAPRRAKLFSFLMMVRLTALGLKHRQEETKKSFGVDDKSKNS